jgi:hypothetical protein
MDIVKKFLKTSIELEEHYHDFWSKIFHNDAYVFIKNAIEFYKNIQNNKKREMYSRDINKRLYTGKCTVVSPNTLNSFNNKNRMSSDELCNFTIQIINILDYVFEICPRLPNNTTVFRYFKLHNDELLLGLQEGDFYRELGINSTTINPYYMFSRGSSLIDSHSSENKKPEKEVYLTIILQKGARCYYTNIPWHYNSSYYQNEFEIVLPRDCIYYIKSKKEFNGKVFITFELVQQIPPKERPIESIEEFLPVRKLNKNDFTYWKPSKEKRDENNWIMKIYKEEYELWNKLPQDQKYATYNSALVSIHPKKIWYYALYNDDKNFMDLQKNKLNIKLILYENYQIYTNDKYLYLPRQLSNQYCEKYFTKNGDNVRNKFFEIDRKIPLLYIIEVNKCKQIKVRKNNSYMWDITNKIDIIVKSIEYKEVVDEYRYGVVKAEMA